jgi:hypothetical protein
MKFICTGAGVLASLVAWAGVASATPHTLPFTYPYETLGEGESEIEAITDMNMLRVYADPTGTDLSKKLYAPQYLLTTEYEYGISDRVELGLYQVFAASPQNGGDNSLEFDGLKWRLRTRLAEAGQWPVDVSLYFELETMHDELSFEEKVNLQKDFGRLRWMANLWVEEPIARPYDSPANGQKLTFVINPTTGFSYQLSPTFHLGLEYWARGMISPVGEDQERSNNTVHHFVGPAASFNFGRFWFTVAGYVQPANLHDPEPGDAYGPFWARAMFGLDLGGTPSAPPEKSAPPEPPTSPESIAVVHQSRCGTCHERVDPGERTREQLETALARHRDRMQLTESQWQAMLEYLTAPPR